MKRWLFNLAAALLFVVFVAVAALWVRSVVTYDLVLWTRSDPAAPRQSAPLAERQIQVLSNAGAICFSSVYVWVPRFEGSWAKPGIVYVSAGATSEFMNLNPARIDQRFLGSRLVVSDVITASVPEHDRFLIVPFWMIMAATAVIPLFWLRRSIRKHRRATKGLCQNCGYDLRATPERCPECGTVPAAVKVTAT